MTTINDTCGTCRFGKFLADDVQQRECHGAPPSIIPMPAVGPDGRVMGMNMLLMRPRLPVEEPACALFEKKQTVILGAQNATAGNG